MSKTYSPGPDADAAIARQVSRGRFASPDEVVRAGVLMLEEHEAELAELRRSIADGDADLAEGRVHRFATAEGLAADVTARGDARSRPAR